MRWIERGDTKDIARVRVWNLERFATDPQPIRVAALRVRISEGNQNANGPQPVRGLTCCRARQNVQTCSRRAGDPGGGERTIGHKLQVRKRHVRKAPRFNPWRDFSGTILPEKIPKHFSNHTENVPPNTKTSRVRNVLYFIFFCKT